MDSRLEMAAEPMDPYGSGSMDPYGRGGMAEPMGPYGGAQMDPYGRAPPYEEQDMYFGPDGGAGPGYGPLDAYGQQDAVTPSAGSNDPNKSYQRYTETGFYCGIDPETGIAPRRLTDCVCAVIFLLYCLGMIILVLVVKNRTVDGYRYSDARRLTHGMDYNARLCGVDEGVEDKPFLFWCRSNPGEWWAPSALDLWNPSCVAECPGVNASHDQVPCLYPEQKFYCSSEPGSKCQIPSGQFGNVVNFHLQSQQSIVYTNPYNTEAIGGRYCLPVNMTLRQTILRGPLHAGVRAFGSFQDCWGVLFLASLLAVVLGYLYVLMMAECAKFMVYGFLGLSLTTFGAAGLFLLASVAPMVAPIEIEQLSELKALNPIFNTTEEYTAMIISIGLGVVLVLIASGLCGTITHTVHAWPHVHELLKTSTECLNAMRSMLIPPLLEALWKFFMAWILTYNFLFLVSVGWKDDHRTEIDGQRFKGLNARFYFDWSLTPWILFYLYGSVWIMELCTAFGHFLVAFSIISWYFMKKEGMTKTGSPPLPPLHGTLDALVYHLGSLCLGAAIIPWVRPIRVWNWILDESFPDEEAECFGPFAILNGCCKCLGNTFGACVSAIRKHCSPTCCRRKGCGYMYTKNVYSDIIIRSQHFLPAAERALVIINNHKATERYMLSCMIITVIGVVTIGSVCATVSYVLILRTPSLHSPTSPTFVTCPLAVALYGFCLCGSIAYGFMTLFDHAADTLLYCHAWNQKFNQDTVDQFVPETLRDFVQSVPDSHDGYQYYGRAQPEMYLATWLPTKSSTKAQPGREQQRRLQRQSQTQPQRSSGSSFARQSGAGDTAGQYTASNGGYAPPEQQEAEGYYYSGGGPR